MQFDLERSLEILQRTPATLTALLDGIDDDWTRSNEGPETFSPFDVVGHLISGEDLDWMPRLRIILEKGEARTFDIFDRFDMWTRDRGRSMTELLEEFDRLRQINLKDLRALNLTPQQLALTGTHPGLGRVTVSQLLATWTIHDLSHISQVARAMSQQYRGAVGPWTAYMKILQS